MDALAEKISIRSGRAEDIFSMQVIEKDGARAYSRATGHEFCVDLLARTEEEHLKVQKNGFSLVALLDDKPVGFALVLPVDKALHLLEMAVKFSLQSRGIGTRLLDEVEQVAVERGAKELTLTTYRDVPWNMPMYQRRGFQVLRSSLERPDLNLVVDAEATAGFGQAPRVTMIKSL